MVSVTCLAEQLPLKESAAIIKKKTDCHDKHAKYWFVELFFSRGGMLEWLLRAGAPENGGKPGEKEIEWKEKEIMKKS